MHEICDLLPPTEGGGRWARALDADPPPPLTKWQKSAGCRRRRSIFFAMGGGKNTFSPHVSILKILRILWRIQSCMKIMKF